jgi:hypothetical protein
LETVAAFLKRVSEEHEQDYEGAKVVRRRGGETMRLAPRSLIFDFVKTGDVLELTKPS